MFFAACVSKKRGVISKTFKKRTQAEDWILNIAVNEGIRGNARIKDEKTGEIEIIRL